MGIYWGIVALPLLVASQVVAGTQIEVVPNIGAPMAENVVIAKVRAHVVVGNYLSVKAQVVSNDPGVVDSVLVYLEDQAHQVSSLSIPMDHLKFLRESFQENLPENYSKEKRLAETTTVFCPDNSVQFISFSHRKLPWDQKAANDVADTAEKAGYKTVRLLKGNATRQNYLNYLSCPRLVGDFYDGDADPDQLNTDDISITSQDISKLLKGAFRNQVTHVWVACNAFQDPMLSAMVKDAASQKFIAGTVALIGGYADRTGVCIMESALQGKSITASFNDCRERLDLKFHNQWGLAGNGSDYLGSSLTPGAQEF